MFSSQPLPRVQRASAQSSWYGGSLPIRGSPGHPSPAPDTPCLCIPRLISPHALVPVVKTKTHFGITVEVQEMPTTWPPPPHSRCNGGNGLSTWALVIRVGSVVENALQLSLKRQPR